MKDKGFLYKYHFVHIDNLEETEKFLSEMAAKGWMLRHVTGSVKFEFEKCEPSDVVFSVDVFSEGSVYDTYTIDSNLEYIEYCKKAGWTFICSAGKIDYFMSADKNTPEIESDQAYKLKTLEKPLMMTKIVSPLLFILMGLVFLITQLGASRNLVFISSLHFTSVFLWVFIMALDIISVCMYLRWLIKARREVAAGRKIPPNRFNLNFRSAAVLLAVLAFLHTAAVLFFGIRFGEKEMLIYPFIWIILLFTMFLLHCFSAYAEKHRLDRDTFRILYTVLLPLGCSAVIIILITASVIFLNGKNKEHELVISSEDLELFGDPQVFAVRTGEDVHWGHFLMAYDRYTIEAYDEEGAKKLEDPDYRPEEVVVNHTWSFDVLRPGSQAVYDLMVDDIREKRFRLYGINFDIGEAERRPELESAGITVWNIRGNYGGIMQKYYIYDGRTLIGATCDEDLTKEQMQVIADSFMR